MDLVMDKFFDIIKNKNQLDHLPCPHPWTTNFVLASGDVTCCTQNSTVLGNISNNLVENIWNSDAAQLLRKKVLDGQYEQAGCDRECPYLRGVFEKVLVPPDIKELIIPDIEVPSDNTTYSKNSKQVVQDLAIRFYFAFL